MVDQRDVPKARSDQRKRNTPAGLVCARIRRATAGTEGKFQRQFYLADPAGPDNVRVARRRNIRRSDTGQGSQGQVLDRSRRQQDLGVPAAPPGGWRVGYRSLVFRGVEAIFASGGIAQLRGLGV
ncbi:hypothetical protein D3C75_704520 [compost metagenome]